MLSWELLRRRAATEATGLDAVAARPPNHVVAWTGASQAAVGPQAIERSYGIGNLAALLGPSEERVNAEPAGGRQGGWLLDSSEPGGGSRAHVFGPEGRRPESLQLARSRLSTKRVGLGVGPQAIIRGIEPVRYDAQGNPAVVLGASEALSDSRGFAT